MLHIIAFSCNLCTFFVDMRRKIICIYCVVCCILCTRTEINKLLTTFSCVFNNNTTCENIFIIIVIYDTAARCPKFCTVKRKIHYRLNLKKNCLFGDPN